MTKEEFEKASYFTVTDDEFEFIHDLYMATAMDKKTFCLECAAFILSNTNNKLLRALLAENKANESRVITMRRQMRERDEAAKVAFKNLASVYVHDANWISEQGREIIKCEFGDAEYYKMRLAANHELTMLEQKEMIALL